MAGTSRGEDGITVESKDDDVLFSIFLKGNIQLIGSTETVVPETY